MSHFMAYLSRMRYINRWGLMRNVHQENIQEHTLQVAFLAHNLAIVKNRLFGGNVDPQKVATFALYHDISEIMTGDLASPIKYFNPEIKKAFHNVEHYAKERLWNLLPPELRNDYHDMIFVEQTDPESLRLIKIADKLSAYIKCLEEIAAGNNEFTEAEKMIRAELNKYSCAELDYFMEIFIPSFKLTLDEMN